MLRKIGIIKFNYVIKNFFDYYYYFWLRKKLKKKKNKLDNKNKIKKNY